MDRLSNWGGIIVEQETLKLFQTLTELPGAPGFEKPIRDYMKQELSGYADEFVQDRLGSLFAVIKGEQHSPKVMVAGHMDEVGFMVTAITPNGMLKFQPLGGWNAQVLLSQQMQVVTKDTTFVGVVASTPPHLLKETERQAVPSMDQMLLDIGADSREHVRQLGIRPGLPIVPVCKFTPMANPKKIMAKAWDNRYGVGLAIELVKTVHDQGLKLPNTLYAGATVQEELGLRGAETAAQLISPDICYVLDASPAADVTGDPQAFGQLGHGALIRILDRTMVSHPRLIEYMLDMAETHDIPYQYFVSPGGTDAGRIHTQGIGVPSAVIGVCARYIHTSASILHVDDYAAAKELLIRLVQNTDQTMLETIVNE